MTTATVPNTRFGIWPVATAGVVLALAILFAALGRHAGIGTVQLPAAEAATFIDLRFEDREGSIRVLSASDGISCWQSRPGRAVSCVASCAGSPVTGRCAALARNNPSASSGG